MRTGSQSHHHMVRLPIYDSKAHVLLRSGAKVKKQFISARDIAEAFEAGPHHDANFKGSGLLAKQYNTK